MRALRWLAPPLLACVAGCGGSSATHPQPPARLVQVPGSHVPSVVLTPLGMQRIGIRTAPVLVARGAGAGLEAVPYAALLYDPDGTAIVYARTGPRTFTETTVEIDHIADDTVYLRRGPAVGTQVVTAGGAELLGAQNGVGAET